MKKKIRSDQGKGAGSFLTTVLLIAAIAVFCFAAYKLIGYYLEYKAGSDEYADLNNQFVSFDGSDDTGSSTDGSADQQIPSDGQNLENVASSENETSSGQEPVPGEETATEGISESVGDSQNTGVSGYERSQEETESVSEAMSEAERDGVRYIPGKILSDVSKLEDPQTVEQEVAQAAKEETTEDGEKKLLPLLRNPIDFDQLQEINPEVIGWLRIGALDISYPVAQAADNDFYLHRTFKKEDNFAGCIFLNCDNSKYFTDQNSIVYGHNMKNGSMFGTLRKFREQETYDENPYFWIFTPTLIYQYRIFSCHEVAKSGEPYMIRFTTQNFQSFIDTMQEESLVDNHGVEVTTQDRIVTLSTCTGNEATRFIVQGKLEQIYRAR